MTTTNTHTTEGHLCNAEFLARKTFTDEQVAELADLFTARYWLSTIQFAVSDGCDTAELKIAAADFVKRATGHAVQFTDTGVLPL